MILKGDKLLISHRRIFERDEPRYFVGEVAVYEGGLVKLTGYSFVRDIANGQVLRKDDKRTKIVSLIAGSVLTYQLPAETTVDAVQFVSKDGNLQLTDGESLVMNMAELPHFGKI